MRVDVRDGGVDGEGRRVLLVYGVDPAGEVGDPGFACCGVFVGDDGAVLRVEVENGVVFAEAELR